MAKGKVKLYRFTIPPGQTAVEIARLLEYLGYGKEKNYVRLMNTESVRIAMGVPYFEGYLFPDTYSIPKGYDERKILELMVKEFRKNFTPAMEEKAKALGLTAEQALIAASIIEKEAGGPEEFPLVSSVIQNRLQKGMRLQMDPTVIYGVKKTFSGNLTREHLQTDHDWNTYTRSGLPKTPICSPSIGALKAAVEPAETDYLYFVAMNNGHHKFTATLKEHNAGPYTSIRSCGTSAPERTARTRVRSPEIRLPPPAAQSGADPRTFRPKRPSLIKATGIIDLHGSNTLKRKSRSGRDRVKKPPGRSFLRGIGGGRQMSLHAISARRRVKPGRA